MLGAEVVRPSDMETTALGAAYLAGLSCGFWKDADALRGRRQGSTVFRPQMSDAARAEKLLAWEDALSRCMYRPRKGREL